MDVSKAMSLMSLIALLACQTAPVAVPVSVPEPATVPMQTPGPAAQSTETSAESVLDRLEAQGKSMKDFSASATVEKYEALTDEKEIRRGRVVVDGPVGAKRRIGLVVDEYIDSTGRGSPDGRRYIFADGWLGEFDVARRQLIRRQIAREGELVDPLRVGDGPFPVPLGQPRAEIAREFIVTLGTLPEAPIFKTLQGKPEALVALKLVPRAGTSMARDTAAMTIVFDEATLAPVAIEVMQVNGDATRAIFRSAKMDAGLDEAARALLTPPPTEGWKIDLRPLANDG